MRWWATEGSTLCPVHRYRCSHETNSLAFGVRASRIVYEAHAADRPQSHATGQAEPDAAGEARRVTGRESRLGSRHDGLDQ